MLGRNGIQIGGAPPLMNVCVPRALEQTVTSALDSGWKHASMAHRSEVMHLQDVHSCADTHHADAQLPLRH